MWHGEEYISSLGCRCLGKYKHTTAAAADDDDNDDNNKDNKACTRGAQISLCHQF